MYIFEREYQYSLNDFNQPMGMELSPNNKWVKKANMIPWNMIEEHYAKLFSDKVGMPAKPLRMALGSLLIQKEYKYSDRELVEQLKGVCFNFCVNSKNRCICGLSLCPLFYDIT